MKNPQTSAPIRIQLNLIVLGYALINLFKNPANSGLIKAAPERIKISPGTTGRNIPQIPNSIRSMPAIFLMPSPL